MKKPRSFIMAVFLFLSLLTLEVETKLGFPWIDGKGFIVPDEPIERDEKKLSLSKAGNCDIAEVTISDIFPSSPVNQKRLRYGFHMLNRDT